MKVILLFLCLIAFAANVFAQTTLYRWVDEQGRVHYSDQPQDAGAAAEEVSIAEPMSYKPDSPTTTSTTTTASKKTIPQDNKPYYQSLAVTAPVNDQVLWNLGGVVSVNLSVRPALLSGHRFLVRFNGNIVEDWPALAVSHEIKNVIRGTHTISVSVVNTRDENLISAEPVSFHVKQTSILN
ncbi:MAG: DUF4124 domain-containing protein [Gammaproteobacteria bacterium]|nr:DUF4124 domain-containing protein [Gammaproteobacteria bacterium]